MTITTAPATTQSLLEFGHAVFGVLHDFAHLPAITAVYLAQPCPVVCVGDPYTFGSAYQLAVWAQAMGNPVRFHRTPLPQLKFRVVLGGITFDFQASMYTAMVEEFEQLGGVAPLPETYTFTAPEVLAALGDHPDVTRLNS